MRNLKVRILIAVFLFILIPLIAIADQIFERDGGFLILGRGQVSVTCDTTADDVADTTISGSKLISGTFSQYYFMLRLLGITDVDSTGLTLAVETRAGDNGYWEAVCSAILEDTSTSGFVYGDTTDAGVYFGDQFRVIAIAVDSTTDSANALGKRTDFKYEVLLRAKK